MNAVAATINTPLNVPVSVPDAGTAEQVDLVLDRALHWYLVSQGGRF